MSAGYFVAVLDDGSVEIRYGGLGLLTLPQAFRRAEILAGWK